MAFVFSAVVVRRRPPRRPPAAATRHHHARQTFENKKDWKKYQFALLYSFKDKDGEELAKAPGDIDGQPFDIGASRRRPSCRARVPAPHLGQRDGAGRNGLGVGSNGQRWHCHRPLPRLQPPPYEQTGSRSNTIRHRHHHAPSPWRTDALTHYHHHAP